MAAATVLRPLVVCVDDNRDHGTTMSAIVKMCGFDALCAESGKEALRVVRQHHPSVILLDVQLPDFDGYTVYKCLKADAGTADIPVIFYTGTGDDGSRAKSLGATAFLTYPVEPRHLFVILDAAVKRAALLRPKQ
ncbi:MAG: response regulator [Terriglobales bacterium]